MITYLKRRFSSGDLQGEAADKREQEGLPSFLRFGSTTTAPMQGQQPQQQPPPSQQQQLHTQPNQTFQTTSIQQQYPYRPQEQSLSGIQHGISGQTMGAVGQTGDGPGRMPPRGRGAYPSAPTSPTRSYGSAVTGGSGGTGMGSFMGPMGSITGQISSTIMRGFSSAASTAQSMATGKSGRERQKVLLVIDDTQTDWSKYFKGKKLFGDWDIRVEQAQYSEITMTAYSDQGCVINIYNSSNRTKPIRTFKPDFVLLREHASGANEDWQPILTGLMYAGTPCMNTLHAVYNMKNRPWLFAHLLLLRNRLGKETFPLINQTYYTSHKEMITAPAFPTIIKVGLGHGGEGKIRADNPMVYQDITSMLVTGNLYATTEPFVDAKCDLHVQKIGPHYKAFARKSISGNWKSNTGSSILEKVPVTERFKQWIDEISRMFGGLDICSVEALQNKAGEYFIYDANGSDMNLFGESQEDDRREIAELVVQRMQTICQQSSMTKTASLQSMGRGAESDRTTSMTAQSSLSGMQHGAQTSTTHPTMMSSTGQTAQPMSNQPSQHQQQSQSFTHPTAASTTGFHPTGTQQPHPPSTQFQQPPSQSHHAGQQMTPSQAPYRATTPSGASSAPLPPKFGGQAPSTGATFSTQPDQGSTSSFGSSSSVFSGISGKMDGPSPSGQNTPVAQRDDGSMPYGASMSLSNQVGSGMSQFNRTSPGQTQFTPTHTTNFGMDNAAWPAPSSKTAGGSTGMTPASSGTMFDSSDSFGRKLTGPTSGLAHPSTVSGTAPSQPQPQTGASVHDSSSTGGPNRPYVPPRQTSLRTGSGAEDSDDTMKNLRKTFAGIFGDM